MRESPSIVHGRLLEAVTISGYTMERACDEFEWLLEDDRWKQVGDGFDNFQNYLDSISLKDFKLTIERREKLVKKLQEKKAPQRTIAKTLGVSVGTVNKDLNDSVQNRTNKEENTHLNESDGGKNGDSVQNRTNGQNQSNNPDPLFATDPKEVNQELKKKREKEQRKEERSKEKEKKRQEKAEQGQAVELDTDFIDLRCGDFIQQFSDIKDGSIDLILTDPPYPKEFIEQWSRLSEFASKKLKKNGFCIAYSGQLNLPEVMRRMNEHLDYYWTFSLNHTGRQQLIQARNLKCGWKPLIVFQNGFKKIDLSIEDVITGTGMEKDDHDWQQAEKELVPIISHFTKKEDVIVDPFAGSGTTLLVSAKLGRFGIGSEIDVETYNVAKKRIYDEIL